MEKPWYGFPLWLHQLTFPPTVHEGALSPHPCQHLSFAVFLIVAVVTVVRGSSIVVLIALPDDSWCWAFFHVSVGHSYVFFGKMIIQFFCSFFSRFVSFFDIEFWVHLYILDINPSPVISFAIIFSHCVDFFVSGFLCRAKALKFNYMPFLNFFLCISI